MIKVHNITNISYHLLSSDKVFALNMQNKWFKLEHSTSNTAFQGFNLVVNKKAGWFELQ